MISYYFRAKESDKQCQQLSSFKTGCWVHIDAANQDELRHIAQKFDLDIDVLVDVLDENEMPRVERSDSNTYIFTRHAFTDDELHITTAPILFVVSPKTLFTFTPQRFERLSKFTDAKIEFSTKNHLALMLQLLDQIDDQYESKLNSISRQIKGIRSRLRVEEIRNKDFVDFVTIEDILNEFLTALSPTNSILRRLLLGKHFSLKQDDQDLVEDLLLNNEQSIEGCKSNLKTIVNIREAYSTIMSNNLNRVIRLLTVLTVVISIPTLIASIYGMNVRLPGQDNEAAFALVILWSLILSLVLLVLLKLRRWI